MFASNLKVAKIGILIVNRDKFYHKRTKLYTKFIKHCDKVYSAQPLSAAQSVFIFFTLFSVATKRATLHRGGVFGASKILIFE